jgi:hypothetical protein
VLARGPSLDYLLTGIRRRRSAGGHDWRLRRRAALVPPRRCSGTHARIE